MRELTVRECLSAGWTTFKTRPWFFAGIWLIILVISALAQASGRTAHHAQYHTVVLVLLTGIIGIAFRILGIIVSIYTQIGTRNFALKARDMPEAVELRDLIRLDGFWRYLGMTVLFLLGFVVGLVLFIVPGIIVAIGWSFAPYLVVEQGAGPVDALKRSWELTRGNRWTLFLLGLALIGINILGFIALIVGLLVSVPVSMFASVHAYRTLLKARTTPGIDSGADASEILLAAA